MRKLAAIIKKLARGPRVKHFSGIPPEVTQGVDKRSLLGEPDLLLLEEKEDGCYILRLRRDGTVITDTWHKTLEEAISQAEFEYGDRLGKWKAVPLGVEDVARYVSK